MANTRRKRQPGKQEKALVPKYRKAASHIPYFPKKRSIPTCL